MKSLLKHLTLVALFVTVALSSSLAAAKTSAELMSHVPMESPVVVGLDMDKLRSTNLFQKGLDFLKDAATSDSLLHFALSKKAFDAEKDIASAVVAFKTAPTNPNAPPPPSMAVISGTFDPARVRKAVDEKFGKVSSRKQGTLEIFTTGSVDFAFLNSETLIIAERAFADPTWVAAKDIKKSAASSKEIQSLLALTDTTRGLWFAVNSRAVPTPEGAPAMDGAGIAVDLRKGLQFEVKSQFAKADDAKKALGQFEDLKKTTDDALIEMLGVKPLVDNLKAEIKDKRVLVMASSMSDWEVKVMLERMKSLNEAPPPVAPAGQKPGTTAAPTTQPTQPAQPGKGANADFN